ncbi:preprotein translocase subunit YajC [Orenia metallireducens]|jgi:preprotein translocase subunit YajC|uniref:Preprotein translocase subunit YajC n=1 Tax=Orenia metallireducens TaxID=1413210 RepID=A0A285G9M3_9FIRM|nr:preprotein translocase subunit YajC [Orenia metallireducens]PRX28295.1 preprotein translocase subunit YajC [Orenia metallireducens]SNY19121.1 preprotein translocase subunit YajC [Orenia metallireducens]
MQILGGLLPFVVMTGLFWFLFIKPQKKRQQERQEMLDSLAVGTDIVTIGGIKGKITEIKDDELSLEIAPEVEIKVSRMAVGRIDD